MILNIYISEVSPLPQCIIGIGIMFKWKFLLYWVKFFLNNIFIDPFKSISWICKLGAFRVT